MSSRIPLKPKSAYPWSSATMRSMLGRFTAADTCAITSRPKIKIDFLIRLIVMGKVYLALNS